MLNYFMKLCDGIMGGGRGGGEEGASGQFGVKMITMFSYFILYRLTASFKDTIIPLCSLDKK